MENIRFFFGEYSYGIERIRQAEERKERNQILIALTAGILTSLVWEPLWKWLLTGELAIEHPLTIIPALIISITGAGLVLPAAWRLLQETPKVIRWLTAYSYGWGSLSVLREGPIEAGLNALNMHAASFAFPMADTTLSQRALFTVVTPIAFWIGSRLSKLVRERWMAS